MSVVKLLISIAILTTGIGCAWYYFRRADVKASRVASSFAGERPWRRVGAGICLVLAVMFVLGIYVVDIPDRPAPYAIYWIIMLGLVVWLFALAVRDVMYTRKLVERWRKEIAEEVRSTHGQAAGTAENRKR